ncbi:uncharacterized protein VTP21DRAFT_5914 [Calcarisporiella thermophila]|uniref:uncharacterized protein n=1 Tax=Calcarisporiella thermophila TaxID=911321 RepID=UPI0037436488
MTHLQNEREGERICAFLNDSLIAIIKKRNFQHGPLWNGILNRCETFFRELITELRGSDVNRMFVKHGEDNTSKFSYPPGERPDCAICLESILPHVHAEATLVCGHIFHLSCIGSAFNSSGIMICPICRRTQNDQPCEWICADRFAASTESLNSSEPDEDSADFLSIQNGVINLFHSLFRNGIGGPFRENSTEEDSEQQQQHEFPIPHQDPYVAVGLY